MGRRGRIHEPTRTNPSRFRGTQTASENQTREIILPFVRSNSHCSHVRGSRLHQKVLNGNLKTMRVLYDDSLKARDRAYQVTSLLTAGRKSFIGFWGGGTDPCGSWRRVVICEPP